MMAEKQPSEEQSGLSLFHMTPDEAIQRAFRTKPPNKPRCVDCGKELPGLHMVDEQGEIRCPRCDLIETYERNQS
jgi:ribosomal protein L34E